MEETVAAAKAMAAPTLPLKLTLTQLSSPIPEGSPHPALARTHHTVTVLDNKAFLFGGEDASGDVCPPGIHTLTLPPTTTKEPPAYYGTAYTCYPPFPLQDAATGETLVPAPRAEHAACAYDGRYLLVHGGRRDGAGRPADRDNCLWQWDSERLSWSKLRGDSQLGKSMAPRCGHWMFADGRQGFVVVVGGRATTTSSGVEEEEEMEIGKEAWMYDFHSMVWTALPGLPVRPVAAAYAGGRVYVISSGEGRGLVHYMDLLNSTVEREKPGALVWRSVDDPGAVHPKPRPGGALVPLTVGHGREYLVYILGCSEGEGGRAEIWTLQQPAHSRSAAAVGDKIREKLAGAESEEFGWAEADIVSTEGTAEGRQVHRGPTGSLSADTCFDGKGVVLWEGINARGGEEGHGWILRLA
ncbi:uncharacterized protein B0T15DRAFT_397457 [Chaetomium strumarium]|uniref:Uncharacterized protein n=1 Tax=Chaetomium strumarium TaxID=1170767 RepID=A0AAJ0GU20_9PEZI|nr:hypothetical protein B0T15DRAFT_397457 [Chaetomium strumarium]